MKADGPVKVVPSSERTEPSSVDPEPSDCDLSQLVDLALKPIFFFLRFNGFPVPPACFRARGRRHGSDHTGRKDPDYAVGHSPDDSANDNNSSESSDGEGEMMCVRTHETFDTLIVEKNSKGTSVLENSECPSIGDQHDQLSHTKTNRLSKHDFKQNKSHNSKTTWTLNNASRQTKVRETVFSKTCDVNGQRDVREFKSTENSHTVTAGTSNNVSRQRELPEAIHSPTAVQQVTPGNKKFGCTSFKDMTKENHGTHVNDKRKENCGSKEKKNENNGTNMSDKETENDGARLKEKGKENHGAQLNDKKTKTDGTCLKNKGKRNDGTHLNGKKTENDGTRLKDKEKESDGTCWKNKENQTSGTRLTAKGKGTVETHLKEKKNKTEGTHLKLSCAKHKKASRACHRCKFVTLLTRVHSIVIGILFFVNAIRYSSIFYTIPDMDGQIVSAMVFQAFFVLIFLVYFASTQTMRKFLPVLISKLQDYEECFGTAVDCRKFYKKAVFRCRFYFWLQATFSVCFLVAEQTVFPSLQSHLAPFGHATGAMYYLALAFFAIVLYFVGSVMYSLSGFLALMTIILHKEFSCLTEELEKVLPKTDHRGRWNHASQHEVQKPKPEPHRKRRHVNPSRRCSGVKMPCLGSGRNGGDSPILLRTIHVHENEKGSKSEATDANTRARTANENEGPDASASNSQNSGKKGANNSTFVHLGSVESLPCEQAPADDISCDNHPKKKYPDYDYVIEDEKCTRNNDVIHPEPHSDDVMSEQASDDVREVLSTTQTRWKQASSGFGSSKLVETETQYSQEEKFDLIHFKHQALCELVDCTNKCVRHLISMSFVMGIFLNCLIIFGLGSGALDVANILFQAWNILFSVFFVTLTTAVGIVINDAAHAPQEIIYAADWSRFSDRLLYKVQLFASRLGHTKIGFDVYGLFVIDKSTVLMVLGTLLTYTIVVIQFQQGGQTLCLTGGNSTVIQ